MVRGKIPPMAKLSYVKSKCISTRNVTFAQSCHNCRACNKHAWPSSDEIILPCGCTSLANVVTSSPVCLRMCRSMHQSWRLGSQGTVSAETKRNWESKKRPSRRCISANSGRRDNSRRARKMSPSISNRITCFWTASELCFGSAGTCFYFSGRRRAVTACRSSYP